MKVAILSRPGACFPNIISLGLGDILVELGVEYRIFYEAIPALMRLLPFSEQPRHWHNSFHFRLYNKWKNRSADGQLLRQLRDYDVIILAECLPNAFWKNYLAIETLRERLDGKPVLSYTDAFIDNAPLHRNKWLEDMDHGKERFDINLCPSAVTELRSSPAANWKAIGVNISRSGLQPKPKPGFTALVDFAQKGYEAYREQQLEALQALNIKTIALEGRYPIEEIRRLYSEAALFFLAFPETFGLPIAECLAGGTMILTPDSAWPMAWRLDRHPMPWGKGCLPDCFRVYEDTDHLTRLLTSLRQEYDPRETPEKVFASFLHHYPHFYYGDREAVREILERVRHPEKITPTLKQE